MSVCGVRGAPALPCVATTPSSSSFATATYTYDGAFSRILATTYTAGDIIRTTTYLYDDFSEQVGTVLDGVTRRDDTTYETDSSNIVWRVESSSVVGPSTNSLIITRTQLTGLSGSCRRHTVTLVGRVVPNAPQTVTETVATFDPDTSIETETTTSSVAPSIVRLLLHGLVLTSETSGVTTVNAYDAFGRIAATSRSVGSAAFLPLQSFDYAPCGDLVLVVRSRCKLNEDGTLKSAHYFQLGEIRFSGDERGAALKFLSIFNPTPNDTNLEPKWSGGAT